MTPRRAVPQNLAGLPGCLTAPAPAWGPDREPIGPGANQAGPGLDPNGPDLDRKLYMTHNPAHE